jgi:hypothetical protein
LKPVLEGNDLGQIIFALINEHRAWSKRRFSRQKSLIWEKLKNKMIYRNFNKEIKKNLIYRITDIVSYLFSLFKIKPRIKYKEKAKKYFISRQQLALNLND